MDRVHRGSFASCVEYLIQGEQIEGQATLVILRDKESGEYHVQRISDKVVWFPEVAGGQWRIVLCVSVGELRCLLRERQRDLFKAAEDARSLPGGE